MINKKRISIILISIFILISGIFGQKDKTKSYESTITKETSQSVKNKLNVGAMDYLCNISIKEIEEVKVAKEEEIIVTEEIVTEPTEEVTTWYTDYEYNLFCHLIYAEAGNTSDQCMYYVGSVVLNRMNSDDFPNTIETVIYQKNQYACTWDGGIEKKIENENVYEIAKDLLDNGSVLPNYVIGQANEYVYQKYGKGLYTTIDGLYFFW